MEDGSEPTPTVSSPSLLISPAIIVVIAIVIFVAVLLFLLCLRKILLSHYGNRDWYPAYCKDYECQCGGCGQCCILLAQKCDCQTPSSGTLLDRICPSQQRCSTFFGQVFSCYCFKVVSEYCKGVHLCPESTGPGLCAQCPECDCPCNCHCECKPPECDEINCGCFKISFRGGS